MSLVLESALASVYPISKAQADAADRKPAQVTEASSLIRALAFCSLTADDRLQLMLMLEQGIESEFKRGMWDEHAEDAAAHLCKARCAWECVSPASVVEEDQRELESAWGIR
jgi:hypothetical protein